MGWLAPFDQGDPISTTLSFLVAFCTSVISCKGKPASQAFPPYLDLLAQFAVSPALAIDGFRDAKICPRRVSIVALSLVG